MTTISMGTRVVAGQKFGLARLARIALVTVLSVGLAGCATTGDSETSRAKKGAVIGAITGALAGAAAGGSDHRAGGALIGAAAGAIAGGLIGKYLDEQAAELDAIPGAEVERREDHLIVNFDNAILFDVGKSDLYPGSYDRLRRLSETLNKYPKSSIGVKGHTDSMGGESYNQTLSEQRADRVSRFFEGEGVAPNRLRATGFGESMPVASNETASGRSQNRRVEIEIRPYQEVFDSEY